MGDSDLISHNLPALMTTQGGFIYNGKHIDYWQRRHAEAAARLKELEAERDQMIRIATTWRERCEHAEGREPAIEAATIERCEEAIKAVMWLGSSPPEDSAFDAVLEAIRALKPPAVEAVENSETTP